MVIDAAPNETPRHVVQIKIGDVEVGEWLDKVTISNAIRDRLRAEIVLRSDVLSGATLDYSGLVSVDVIVAGRTFRRFTGVVSCVRTEDGLVFLSCDTGDALTNSGIVAFAHEHVKVPELIWSIARSAGYDEDQLDIEGVELLQPEAMETLIPLEGIVVDEPISFGDIWLIPGSEAAWVAGPWSENGPAQVGNGDHLALGFLRSSALVRTHAVHARLYDAEQDAIQNAEFVAAWLIMRLRFSAASLPGGEVQGFSRACSNSSIRVSRLAAVRADSTDRRWLRVTENATVARAAGLPRSTDGSVQPPVPANLSLRDREAVLAFWRAASMVNPLASVIALWDAIEFYVGGTSVPSLFDRDDLQQLRDECPAWLDPQQRERYVQMIDSLNNVPLFVRLRAAVEADDVPVSEAEFDLLSRLRRVRNPAQHGKERRLPDQHDLRRAWSIVARMLVYRFSTAGRPETGDAAD